MLALLNHQLKEKKRSTLWQKNILLNILLGIMGLFLFLTVIGIGFSAEAILKEFFGNSALTENFTKLLFYYFVYDLIFRFIMQQLPALSILRSLHGRNKSDVLSFINENKNFYTEDIFERKYIRELSAGNKNKLGILAAMLSEPEILILDEPFSYLDPRSQSWLKSKLTLLNNEGVTILISSHDIRHVTEICNRVLLLENGVIISDTNTNTETLAKLEDYFNV